MNSVNRWGVMTRYPFYLFIFVLIFPLQGNAGTSGGIYDMSKFLTTGHPFADSSYKKQYIPLEKSKLIITKPTVKQTVISKPATRSKNETQALPIDKKITLFPKSKSMRNRVSPVRKGNKTGKNAIREISPIVREKKVSVQQAKVEREYADGNKYLTNNMPQSLTDLRVGLLLHDTGPFSNTKEDGLDVNVEALFKSPAYLEEIGSPKPHVGITINNGADTNQLYGGLTWNWGFDGGYFIDFSLGAAIHDGETETDRIDKKSLGCSLLFRESIGLGYVVKAPHSLMLHFDHISNAKLCNRNEGLENLGLRYGYSF